MDFDKNKEFDRGTYVTLRRDRFDSVSERRVCIVLNRILADYGLTENMQIRLTPQQALDNYVEINNSDYDKYYRNKFKWMKFDFIFEQVYEDKDKYGNPRMNYIPILVVEFDGPHHMEEKQQKIDYYKNGVATKMGAGIVRIKCDEVNSLSEEEIRNKYEEEIITELIRGYFTKSINNNTQTKLIEDGNKKYLRLRGIYDRLQKQETDERKKKCYLNMCRCIEFLKETGMRTKI